MTKRDVIARAIAAVESGAGDPTGKVWQDCEDSTVYYVLVKVRLEPTLEELQAALNELNELAELAGVAAG